MLTITMVHVRSILVRTLSARSSRPTFPSQPLLEFRFGSHLHLASPPSTSLPVPCHFRTDLTSSKSLARIYQKTPGVRTACSISARAKTAAPTSAKSNPGVSYPSHLLLTPCLCLLREKFPRNVHCSTLCPVPNRNDAPSPNHQNFANRLPETPVTTQQSLPFRPIDPSSPAP